MWRPEWCHLSKIGFKEVKESNGLVKYPGGKWFVYEPQTGLVLTVGAP